MSYNQPRAPGPPSQMMPPYGYGLPPVSKTKQRTLKKKTTKN